MPRVKKRESEDQGDTSSAKRKNKNGSRGRKTASYVEAIDEIPDALIEQIKLKSNPYSGELLFAGGTHWDMTGRSRPPKVAGPKPLQGGRNLVGPHRLGILNGVRVRAVFSGPTSCHSIIVSEEGKAYSWGRNICEQLGHGDSVRRDEPTLIEGLKQYTIVNAATGRNHTLCLTETGTVFAFGDNKFGQLGLGHQTASMGVPCKLLYKGQPIVKVACGGDFSMILDCRGNLHSFGHPEYSQLGHNSTGQYFVTSSKLTFDCVLTPRRIPLFIERSGRDTAPVPNVVIKDVACGANHSVAMDMQGRVFTWGFGGYGRLGHNGPKDEPIPCSVKIFDIPNKGGRKIWAGATFSMALNECKSLLLWGQTKRTGEAAMYPKPLQDLAGWNIRDVGCSTTSIVIAADESVISWGPSPTYGELCYGENAPKSSTFPKEAKPLEGMYIHGLTCGMGHALLIARDDTEEERARIKKFPWFGPVREITEEELLEKKRKAEEANNVHSEEDEEVVEDMTPSSAAAAAAAAAAARAAAAAEEDESPTLVPFTVQEPEKKTEPPQEKPEPVPEKSAEPEANAQQAEAAESASEAVAAAVSEPDTAVSEQDTAAPVSEAPKVKSDTAEAATPVNGTAKMDENESAKGEESASEAAAQGQQEAAEAQASS